MRRSFSHKTLASVVAVLLAVCGSTRPSSGQDNAPTVRPAGKTVVLYQGPHLETLVDYGFAQSRLGDEWMVLNAAVVGIQSASEEVRSDSIWLRMPNGTRIPLPAYEAFADAWGEVQSISRRATIAAQPLNFTRADRNWCHMSFLPDPGTAAVLTSVYVNYRKGCSGLLYFPIPGGSQPGRYAIIIKLQETDVVVPFELALKKK